jgi:hypothetical protein
MAAPGEFVQFKNVFDYPYAQRVKVNVSNEFQKIRVFLTNNGFIAVLEEMSTAMMAQVECDGIACQEPPHKLSKLALRRT